MNFWATWCAPCRREIPLLKALRAERGGSGVEVVGIAVDFRDDVLEYAREIGIDYPLLIGEQDGLAAARAFGMDMVLPFTVFADGQRRIVALKVGELHADEAGFILDMVTEVNAGRLELAAARTAIAAKLRLLADEPRRTSRPGHPATPGPEPILRRSRRQVRNPGGCSVTFRADGADPSVKRTEPEPAGHAGAADLRLADARGSGRPGDGHRGRAGARR